MCLSSATVTHAQAFAPPVQKTFTATYTQYGTYFGYTWVQGTLTVTAVYASLERDWSFSYSYSCDRYQLSAADVFAGMKASGAVASLYSDGDGMTLKVYVEYQIFSNKAVGYEYDYVFIHWSEAYFDFTCWGYSSTSGQ
jgi:hypothetical protein